MTGRGVVFFEGQPSVTTFLTRTPPPHQLYRHTHPHTHNWKRSSSWLTLWSHFWNTHCPPYPVQLHTLSLEGGRQQLVRVWECLCMCVCVCASVEVQKKLKSSFIFQPRKEKEWEAGSLNQLCHKRNAFVIKTWLMCFFFQTEIDPCKL